MNFFWLSLLLGLVYETAAQYDPPSLYLVERDPEGRYEKVSFNIDGQTFTDPYISNTPLYQVFQTNLGKLYRVFAVPLGATEIDFGEGLVVPSNPTPAVYKADLTNGEFSPLRHFGPRANPPLQIVEVRVKNQERPVYFIRYTYRDRGQTHTDQMTLGTDDSNLGVQHGYIALPPKAKVERITTLVFEKGKVYDVDFWIDQDYDSAEYGLVSVTLDALGASIFTKPYGPPSEYGYSAPKTGRRHGKNETEREMRSSRSKKRRQG